MFNDLNEHPLFKQRKNRINENEDLNSIDYEASNKNKNVDDSSFRGINIKSKSKSFSDLLVENNTNSEIIQLKVKDSNVDSSFFIPLQSRNRMTDEENSFPFPLPKTSDFIKSRTDLNVDEVLKLNTKILNLYSYDNFYLVSTQNLNLNFKYKLNKK
jgi:hypothetical protein